MSSTNQPVKARLRVILMADAVTVAEVESPGLWQRILSEVNGNISTDGAEPFAPSRPSEEPLVPFAQNGHKAIASLAKILQIEPAVLEGALSPKTETPYLTLDVHCWERMKKQLVGAGASAIAALAVAGTLLVLWCREAGIESPTQSQAQAGPGNNRYPGQERQPSNPKRELATGPPRWTDPD
jgi:hypothetical protein